MQLVIAEKPSVAKSIADVLGVISFPERFPDRTAVPAAERRVYKSDPPLNPRLGGDLSHATGITSSF